MIDLSKVPTRELVEELCIRDGVKCTVYDPYESDSYLVNGPVILLEVSY